MTEVRLARGTTLSSRRYRIEDETHDAHAALGWHTHEAPMISLVLRGRYQEGFRHLALECVRGDAVVKPAAERHCDRVGTEGARSLLVQLQPDGEPWFDDAIRGLAPQRLRSATVDRIVTGIAGAWHATDPFAPLAIEAGLLHLMTVIRRGDAGPVTRSAPAWIGRAVEFIRDEFHRALTVDRIAAECGVHPAHLARVFRERLGQSVGEYVRSLRVETAANRIAATDDPLATIAAQCGFFDQSHMGRHIRRRYGLTPRELRRSHRRAG